MASGRTCLLIVHPRLLFLFFFFNSLLPLTPHSRSPHSRSFSLPPHCGFLFGTFRSTRGANAGNIQGVSRVVRFLSQLGDLCWEFTLLNCNSIRFPTFFHGTFFHGESLPDAPLQKNLSLRCQNIRINDYWQFLRKYKYTYKKEAHT